MKKQTFIIMSTLVLISCANNKSNDENYKVITSKNCSKINIAESKTNRIDQPTIIPQGSPIPYQVEPGFKKIDDSINVIPDIGILKENKFIALYGDMNSQLVMGKIFDNSGQEIINRFKIVDYNSTDYRIIGSKLVTDKKLDYFFVFYLVTNQVKNEFFVRKFDLSGNQIGSETRLDVDAKKFSNVTYSFDQNGKNLILSWVDPITKYEKEKDDCPPFNSCNTTGPRGHNLSVIKYIKFDDNLNYCFNSIELDLPINNNNYGIVGLLHITKDREKIIFTVDYRSIKVLNLKNNQILDIFIDAKEQSTRTSKFTEDDQNYYFINSGISPKSRTKTN